MKDLNSQPPAPKGRRKATATSPSPTIPPASSAPASGAPLPPDPATTPDTDDPGDSTQRNFRYQYAYGVILMAAARRGERPYVAIWCEHHEDLLAERFDRRYDGYQIKTCRPENGAWRMNDPDMVKSIGRFVDLVGEFGDRIGDLFFVSNTEYDHCGDNHRDERRRAGRPRAFLAHVHACASHADIASPYATTFAELQGQCGCQPEELFVVLRRMDLIAGPPRSAFDTVVAHEHLGRLEGCAQLTVSQLDEWCRDLISVVANASSLVVTDPIRHLRPLIDGTDVDPTLAAKRLVVADVMTFRSQGPVTRSFKFPGQPGLQVGTGLRPSMLQEKLERGDLADQVEYLRGRERAAEYNLMEEASREPDGFEGRFRQLEEVVLGECTESHLRARVGSASYGPAMMIDVQNRLRQIAEKEPQRVSHHPYECLLGIVALLTSDTRVWWSPRFPVQESAA